MEGSQTVDCPGNLLELPGSKRPEFCLCSPCKGRKNQRILCYQSPEKGIEPIAYCEIAGLSAGFELSRSASEWRKSADFLIFSSPLLAPSLSPDKSIIVRRSPENQQFLTVGASTRIRPNSLQLTVSDGTFDGIKSDREGASCSPIWPCERQHRAKNHTSFPIAIIYLANTARTWHRIP